MTVNGKYIDDSFCGDCGSTLFRTGESWPGFKVLKAGVMDDEKWMNEMKPAIEYFVSQQVAWVAPVEGAEQRDRMS